MTTYRLASTPLFHSPGFLAWAINGYHFKKDRPALMKTMSAAFPAMPKDHLHRILTGEIGYEVEGETVIVRVSEQ